MVHYGLNKIKLAFDAQYKMVIFTLLTYVLSDLCFTNHWFCPLNAGSNRPWLLITVLLVPHHLHHRHL